MAIGAEGQAAAARTGVGHVRVLGWSFDDPVAFVVDGSSVFVANQGSDTVTELAAPSMDLVRVISGPQYHFEGLDALALVGDDVFALSAVSTGGSLTEFSALTGALVRVISSPADELAGADNIAVAGNDLFVTDQAGVTEINALTGALVRVLTGKADDLYEANLVGIVADGPYVVVMDNSVTTEDGYPRLIEFRASTGALVRSVPVPSEYFSNEDAMVADGPDVAVFSEGWHAKGGAGVTAFAQVSVRAGAVRVTTAPSTGLGHITGVVADGARILVTYGPQTGAQSYLAEFATVAGKLTRTFLAGGYDLVDHDWSGTGQGDAIGLAGNDIVLAGSSGQSIVEVNASTKAVAKVVTGSPYRFSDPAALALAGDDLFVANEGSAGLGSITELNATSGALVRVFSSAKYHLVHPDALVLRGADLFVANSGLDEEDGYTDASVTEIDIGTGAQVMVISGPRYELYGLNALALYGEDLFIESTGSNCCAPGPYYYEGGTLTEINATTGALVQVLSGPQYEFDFPVAMAVDGTTLLVANRGDAKSGSMLTPGGGVQPATTWGPSVTEVNAATGSVFGIVSGSQFTRPVALAAAGRDVFVLNGADKPGSLVEFNISSGAVVEVANGPGGITNPQSIAIEGPRLFLAGAPVDQNDGTGEDSWGPGSLVQLSTPTMSVTRALSGSRYDFEGPLSLAVNGKNIFVASGSGGSVTQLEIQ